jgi:hypothetical protein
MNFGAGWQFFAAASFSLVTNALWAQTSLPPFNVRLSSPKDKVEVLQRRAELAMARSVDYCRGATMPMPESQWNCRDAAGEMQICDIGYFCRLTSRSFNRVTETRRLIALLKALPVDNSKLALTVENPWEKLEKMQAKEKAAEAAAVAKKTTVRRDTGPAYGEVALPWEELKDSALGKIQEIPNVEQDLADLEAEERALGEPEKAPRQVKEEETTEAAPPEAQAPVAESSNERKRTDWMAFSLLYIQVAADVGASVTTFGGEWAPRIRFGENIALRGQLGLHSLETEVLGVKDSFFVYDLGAFIEYRLFWSLYFEIGGGFQKWSDDTGDMNSAMTVGMGWRFDYQEKRLLDRIFVSLTSVGNDAGNSEMHAGIGLTF